METASNLTQTAGIKRVGQFLGGNFSIFVIVALTLGGAVPAWSGEFEAEVAKAYSQSKSNYLTSPKFATHAWQFARACFDLAELATNNTQRASLAEEGIAATRKGILREPNSAPCHYYLAMNLGQLARTKTLGALRIVNEMEKEFKAASRLDPLFDYAGPHRSLGILYLEAPGWPASIGNKHDARVHLEKAVKLAPDYPDNHLSLMEAYSRWGEESELEFAKKRYRKKLPQIKEKFSGKQWEQEWKDWDRRWENLR